MIHKLGVQRRFGYLLLLSVLSSLFGLTELTDVMCGQPGYTSICHYTPQQEQYHVGQNVTYNCTTRNCHDPMTRKCLNSGSWSRKVPVCHYILGPESLSHPIYFTGENAGLSMDRNLSTCSRAESRNKSYWIAKLNTPCVITKAQVHWESNIKVSIKVLVQDGNKTEEVCETDTSDPANKQKYFICPRGLVVDKIFIIHESLEASVSQWTATNKYFQVCEVLLFTGPRTACVRPDLPYKGKGHKIIADPSIYQFSCAAGYEIVGASDVRCQSDGSWAPTSPTCRKLSHCGELPSVANGFFRFNSTSINSVAWLECNDGYRSLNDNTTYCLPTGLWTSLSHRCAIIKCDANPHIPHGKGVLLSGSTIYGSKLQIICDRGYVPVESELRQCLKDATWGNLDICVEINCGPLKMEASYNGQWIPLNGTIFIKVLVCEAGYHIVGYPPVAQCLSNRSWSYTSAVCRRTPTSEIWNSNWSPHTIIMIAIAVGAGTAILVLSLAVCGWLLKKRRHSVTNSNSVFHIGATDCSIYNNGKEEVYYKTNTYEDVIELRNNPTNTKPRKPSSALPHIPVDTDPVYAQPFEAPSAQAKILPANTTEDFCTAHIYAEPVDSQRPPSDPISACNSAAETWLRNGARKFGRKMSLPGQSITSRDLIRDQSYGEIYKSTRCSTNGTFEGKTFFEPKAQDTFTELINNAIYLDIKDTNFMSEGDDMEKLQMIDNDIYQDDYFSHA